jgi:hypothetical protein
MMSPSGAQSDEQFALDLQRSINANPSRRTASRTKDATSLVTIKTQENTTPAKASDAPTENPEESDAFQPDASQVSDASSSSLSSLDSQFSHDAELFSSQSSMSTIILVSISSDLCMKQLLTPKDFTRGR